MKTHKLTINDLQLNVSIRGQGSPLLLLNGLGGLIRTVDPLREELADYRTITLDVPGVGKSQTPRWPMRQPRHRPGRCVRRKLGRCIGARIHPALPERGAPADPRGDLGRPGDAGEARRHPGFFLPGAKAPNCTSRKARATRYRRCCASVG